MLLLYISSSALREGLSTFTSTAVNLAASSRLLVPSLTSSLCLNWEQTRGPACAHLVRGMCCILGQPHITSPTIFSMKLFNPPIKQGAVQTRGRDVLDRQLLAAGASKTEHVVHLTLNPAQTFLYQAVLKVWGSVGMCSQASGCFGSRN